MKRVLIVTYYWPPNGGAGVQRWLKFVKYLPQHGWQPVVYTPENPELVAEDPGLLDDVPREAEVIKRRISEPYGLYKRLTGRGVKEKVHTAFLSEEKREGWRDRMALWVRSNFFIPDARVGWVGPSVRFLKQYLREHPVDVIVTTGPPHSMHLIGLRLKRALGIRWVADFRDPWTNIDFYRQLKLSRSADRRHRRLEAEVLREADTVVAVGWTLADELRDLGAERVEVITNGFDPADVPDPPEPVDERYSLVHVGSLTATRNAPGLWKALAKRCADDPEFAARFVLRFVGPVDHTVLDSIEEAGLADNLERIGPVDHAQAMREMQRARVLLLLLNDTANAKGILTSKLFEYLAVGRPILAVGPKDGDVARVLKAPHVLVERG
ncbi:MAG: glycosyltransferase family 4 protein, partial [Flavobacteriales bacterium]|nr:glycosyltransferase family 4 protein [Flavobacteriales bacterium]MCB0815305.1 glycosyltransferase family 4 protein [Flavobacteriales bacterium]